MASKFLALTAIGVVGLAAPAYAHHSYAMFDPAQVYVWEGTVVKFDWANPHSHILIKVGDDAKDKKTVGTWDIEGAAPNIMSRQGWWKMAIKPGDKITIVGQPLKDGGKAGALFYAIKDGKRLYVDVNRHGGPGAQGRGLPPGYAGP